MPTHTKLNQRTSTRLRALMVFALVAAAIAITPPPAAADNFGCPRPPPNMNVIYSDEATITGTSDPDFICAGPGDNSIHGGAGDDKIYGGHGDDIIFGGPGRDELHGGQDNDVLKGMAGNDTLSGGPGHDLIRGGSGHDALIGNDGNDRLFGAKGRDKLDGGEGTDHAIGGKNADLCLKAERKRSCELGVSTMLVSRHSDGSVGIGDSARPSSSDDGRFIAFQSDASNLVEGDTNEKRDIFVRDTATGETIRVNTSSAGEQADLDSKAPSISGDGKVVAFVSDASNLATEHHEFADDIYISNVDTGSTTVVPTPVGVGDITPALSYDGRFATFPAAIRDPAVRGGWNISIFRADTEKGTSEVVSTDADGISANDFSSDPKISADGRYITFVSWATNFVPGTVPDSTQVYWKDLLTGELQLVSSAADGTLGDAYSSHPDISADGRHVIFTSIASNLTNSDESTTEARIYRKDLRTGAISKVSDPKHWTPSPNRDYHVLLSPTLSGDGSLASYLVRSGDGPGAGGSTQYDLVVVEIDSGKATEVRPTPDGRRANARLNDARLTTDGRYVTFSSPGLGFVFPEEGTGFEHTYRHQISIGARPL